MFSQIHYLHVLPTQIRRMASPVVFDKIRDDIPGFQIALQVKIKYC